MSDSTEFKLLKLIPLVRWLLAGAMAMAGWVATIELRSQGVSLQSALHETRLYQVELWRAETAASRYTSAEANRLQSVIAEALAAHDKRITRNEDSLLQIKILLEKIDRKIEPR